MLQVIVLPFIHSVYQHVFYILLQMVANIICESLFNFLFKLHLLRVCVNW